MHSKQSHRFINYFNWNVFLVISFLMEFLLKENEILCMKINPSKPDLANWSNTLK